MHKFLGGCLRLSGLSHDTVGETVLNCGSFAPKGRQVRAQNVLLYYRWDKVQVGVLGLDKVFAPDCVRIHAGHNGAGKTTAISILTGMLTPTSGDASVYGASILTDMPRIRQSLGVCPQFDILWPEITAREHLTLYAAIKGFRGRDARAVAERAARDVGESSWFHSPLPHA